MKSELLSLSFHWWKAATTGGPAGGVSDSGSYVTLGDPANASFYRPPSQTEALAARRLDEMHDEGEDLTPHVDLARATHPGREVQRVNVDFPIDLLRAIGREARRIGVSRQAFIKLRLADTLTISG